MSSVAIVFVLVAAGYAWAFQPSVAGTPEFLLRFAAPSRIVNIGSIFGDIAYPLFAPYSASKFALRGLSMAMRRELKPYGIGVTYAAPRATKTDPTKDFEELVKPLKMHMDDPAVVAAQIWRAVSKDLDTAYAKGAERLFG